MRYHFDEHKFVQKVDIVDKNVAEDNEKREVRVAKLYGSLDKVLDTAEIHI